MDAFNEITTQIKAVFTENKTVSLIILGVGVVVGAILF